MHVLDQPTVDAIAEWLVAGGPGVSAVPPSLRSRVTAIPALASGLLDESVLR